MTPLRVKQAIERYNYLTKAEFDDYSESIDWDSYITSEELSEMVGFVESLQELLNENVIRYSWTNEDEAGNSTDNSYLVYNILTESE
jgi:hypothetical protein